MLRPDQKPRASKRCTPGMSDTCTCASISPGSSHAPCKSIRRVSGEYRVFCAVVRTLAIPPADTTTVISCSEGDWEPMNTLACSSARAGPGPCAEALIARSAKIVMVLVLDIIVVVPLLINLRGCTRASAKIKRLAEERSRGVEALQSVDSSVGDSGASGRKSCHKWGGG